MEGSQLAGTAVTPLHPRRSERLEALLRDLPPEHRAIVECLDADREDQVRVAERHAEALHRLQEAAISIARVLEREAIERELARHSAKLASSQGAIVSGLSGPNEALTPAAHWYGTDFTSTPAPEAVANVMREAVRTGRAVREAAHGGVIAM